MGPPQLVNIKVVWRVASDRAPVCARERRGVLLVLSWCASRESVALCPASARIKANLARRPTSSLSAEYVRMIIFNESQGKSCVARGVSWFLPAVTTSRFLMTRYISYYMFYAFRTIDFAVNSRYKISHYEIFTLINILKNDFSLVRVISLHFIIFNWVINKWNYTLQINNF